MKENKIPYKTYLDESEIPTKWYNVRADMKNNQMVQRPRGYEEQARAAAQSRDPQAHDR